jgi:hypothetical protein
MKPDILFKSLDELNLRQVVIRTDVVGLTLTNQWFDPEYDVLYQLFEDKVSDMNRRYSILIWNISKAK